MDQQRVDFGQRPASHDSFATNMGPLPGDRIDRLLENEDEPSDAPDTPHAPPMNGIWLGVGLGIALWCAVAGLIVLATRLS